MHDDPTLAELRPRLVAAMLPHVPFDGWSPAALRAAAADAGIDADLAMVVFTGPADMVDAYTALADEAMTAALAAEGIETLKVRERIRRAVRTRLEQALLHREAVRRALAVLAMPANAALGARILWRTADAMWRAAGDSATDFNHYSKRLILGGVYSATLLVWLDDASEGEADTWAFLDRRIDGVMRFEKAKARLRGVSERMPSPVRFLGRLRYPAV